MATLTITRGEPWSDAVALTDLEGNPYNLTGTTLTWYLKRAPADADASAVLTLSWVYAGAASGIAVADVLDGIATVSLNAAQTAALSTIRYVYQLTLLDNVGDTRTVSAGVFVVAPAVLFVTANAGGVTRRQLRRTIGQQLGDVRVLTASEDSTALDIFADTVRLRDPAQTWTGRWAFYAAGDDDSATNVSTLRRVAGSTNAGKLTVSPPWPALPLTGDILEVYNNRNQGWNPEDIHDAINACIRQARKLHRIEVVADVSSAIAPAGSAAALDAVVDLPAAFGDLFAVEYLDANANYQDLPPQDRRNGYGFRLDEGSRTVIVGALSASSANSGLGADVRLRGYGDPPELHADADTTTVDEEWIVWQATANLLAAYDDGHPERGAQAYAAQRRADGIRSRIRTRIAQNTIRIRP